MSEVFADVPSEGATLDIDKAFERLETKEKAPAEESTTEKGETDKPSQEGEKTPVQENVPFHKHPRWQKTQAELKEAKDKLARLEAEGKQGKEVVLPKWYADRYGDSEESKNNYQAIVQKDGELEWLKQEILGELENRTKSEQQQVQQGEEFVNTQLSEMADEGLKFERNSLLKFMVDFQSQFGAGALVDQEGNYDFRKALTLMEKMTPKEEAPNVKKQVAAIGSRGKASTQKSSDVPVLSRNALRNGNWRDADK